jgi:shikimate kinase
MSVIDRDRNLVLVGMPGAGKSTIGVLLAKYLAMDFVDTDLLIQVEYGDALQRIVDTEGYMALRRIEETVIMKTQLRHTVIATGGSAVYSSVAMVHLKQNGTVVFLDVALSEIKRRVKNFDNRGIARRENQTFDDLFFERVPLYRHFADLTVVCDSLNQDEVALAIIEAVAHL